jgi:5-methyltetrahydropteroyltriglutamate--homocysteine methyltransferase
MFETTIAGSLPKPAWLAEPDRLWAPWRLQGQDLIDGKRDATLLAVKIQEDAGIDIVGDGEQARQHFVHGFLENIEGIDFAHKVEMGIRDNRYKAMVPTVTGELTLRGRVHAMEAQAARAHTKRKLKFTLPGPMTISDTVADGFYGDKVKMAFAFADLLNQEARALQRDGVDVIQFDEPAFNVFTDQVAQWGVEALQRAAAGLTCTTAVHVCYGYGIKANTDWKKSLGSEWRQYETIFPAIAKSRIQQVSVECRNSKVPLELLSLLKGKDIMVGVIDVASDAIETPEDVAATIEAAMKFVPKEKILACTNCGMAPMHRDIAVAKLNALGAGAALARKKLA